MVMSDQKLNSAAPLDIRLETSISLNSILIRLRLNEPMFRELLAQSCAAQAEDSGCLHLVAVYTAHDFGQKGRLGHVNCFLI